MSELPKYHLDISTRNFMFHLRTDDVTDIENFTGLKQGLNCEIIVDYFKRLEAKSEGVEVKIVKEPAIPNHPNYCHHQNTREISGQGKWGPWSALKCLDCNSINFRSKNGEMKGWTPAKEKKETELPF